MENSDFLRARSSRRNYILMEEYLAKMRKIYFKATEQDVDWWYKERDATDSLELFFFLKLEIIQRKYA